MYTERINTLYERLEESNFEAIAIIPSPTFVYLTGLQFGLDERPKVLFLGKNIQPTLILPQFESGLLSNAAMDIQAFPYGENQDLWPAVFRQACEAAGLAEKNVGIEPLHIRARELFLLQEASPETRFLSASDALESMRMQKDEQEISKMRKAVQIAQDAFLATLPFVKAGVTEREIAATLVIKLLELGSFPDIAFSPIVGSGPNGANPHSHPTNRKLQPGDLVVIDWGARFEGYCSDITRTLAIGSISPELEKCAEIVAEANKAGRNAARTGAAAAQVDQAARSVIEKAGYGQFFTHRTGHGLGMEVHEPPYMTAENTLILKSGMTFTVEPGIYMAGNNGIRIEDNVVVGEQSGESLTDLPRELFRIA